MTAERESTAFSIARAVALVSFWTVIWLGVGATLVNTLLVDVEPGGSVLGAIEAIVMAFVFLIWAVVGAGFGWYLFAASGGLDLPWSGLSRKVPQLLAGLLIGGGAGLVLWLVLGGRAATLVECWDGAIPGPR